MRILKYIYLQKKISKYTNVDPTQLGVGWTKAKVGVNY